MVDVFVAGSPAQSIRDHFTTSRADLEVLSRTEEKVRREVDAAEQSLASMSVRAPKSGVFLVSNFWQWGPGEGRRNSPA